MADKLLNSVLAAGTYVVNTGESSRPLSANASESTDVILNSLSKIADKTYAAISDKIKYTITFTNNSSVDMDNVSISDALSNQTTLNVSSIVPAPQTGETLATGISVGSVTKGSTKTLVYEVTVNNGAIGTISSTASSNYTFTDSDTNTQNGITGNAVFDVTVASPSIVMTKTADKTFVDTNGEELTYTIIVTNSGNLPVSGIVVTDTYPTGVTYKANTTYLNGSTTATNDNPSAGITIGDLATGGSYSIVFTTTVAI